MAFPTIAAPTTQLLLSSTSHPVNMPASVAAGRLLVVITGTSKAVTTPSGWTLKKALTASTLFLNVYTKIADGSEGGTTVDFVTASSDFLASHLYYASDANYTIANCFAISTGTTGTSTTPDPDSLTSGFGATDTTWIAAMVGQVSDVTGFPASYGNTAETFFGYGVLASADRDVNGASQNPGAFAQASAAWAAVTIGIQINPAAQPTISSVSPSIVSDTLAGVVITGTNYNASKGAGKVEISDSPTYGAGTLVVQTTTAWGATSITFTVGAGSFGPGTLYVYVTNNEGGVSAAYTISLVDAPIALGTIKGIGAQPMGVEVYERDDLAASLGFLRIIDADTDEAVDEIGAYWFTLPANLDGVSILSEGRVVAIHRETEGALLWGIIDDLDYTIQGGRRLLKVSGPTLDDELNYLTTHRALIFDDVAPATAFAAIVSPAGWTTDLTGSGYNDITKRYDNMGFYGAALDFAHLQRGYLRRTSTIRQLEIKNTSQQTGIRLRNFENVDPAMLDNPSLGLIQSMTYKRQGREIYNKIIPEGKTDGDRIYGLRSSDRSSPYTIQNEFIVSPSIVSVSAGTAEDLNVRSQGVNRVALAIVDFAGSVSGFDLHASLGGQQMNRHAPGATYFATEDVTRMTFILVNPPVGDLVFTTEPTPTNNAARVYIIQDADQVSPIRDYNEGTGTGTSISTAVTSVVVGDLVIDDVIQGSTNATNTAGAGQTELYDASPASGIDRQVASSSEVAAGTSVTMSWSWTGSETWHHFVVAIRPALAYFIADATSDTAYGTREKHLAMGDFKPINGLTLTNAANAMYDKAVDFLEKHLAPLRVFDAPISTLNQSPLDWNVGDALHVDYQDPDAGIDLNEYMVVVRRLASYRNGVRHWKLTLADVARNPVSDASYVANMQSSIAAIQANQV